MISVWMDANEKGSDRAKAMETTVAGDDRFSWQGFADLPVDLKFSDEATEGLRALFGGHSVIYVELKESADFVQSVLSGHLYSQILALQELGEPAFVAVLGSSTDINKAVKDSVLHRRTAGSKHETVAATTGRLRDFRAKANAINIPVIYDMTPGDILSHVYYMLSDNVDMLAHRPKPADGERQVAALCMLVPGVGPKKARALLDHFGSFRVLMACSDDVEDVPGIGRKLAKSIVEALR